MMKQNLKYLARYTVAFALLLAACDTTSSSIHEDEVVVESYLVADEPLPVVRLSLTTSISDIYNVSQLGIFQ